MWNEIKDESDLQSFLEYIRYFHDSCIKELRYVSGAYVDHRLAMIPINKQRNLRSLLQQQK